MLFVAKLLKNKPIIPILVSCLVILVGSVTGQPKVALVLSGGGAQGMAHIGVFKAFEEYNIPIDLIVGSSAGALVGGLYAAGVSVAEMEEMVRDGTIEHLFIGRPKRSDLPIWQRDEIYLGNLSLGLSDRQIVGSPGLLDDKLIWKELFLLTAASDFKAHWNFDSLYVPFRAVASDLRKQAPYVFDSGPLANALRPSMSIPLIYSPIQQNGQVLVDGGIYAKLPVEIAEREDPDFIIAVSAEDAPDQGGEIQGIGGMFETVNSRILAGGDSTDVRGWDYFFRVPTAGHHVLDFPAGEALMEAGYQAGIKAAQELVEIFKEKDLHKRVTNPRDAYRFALDGRLLELVLISEDADFDPQMMRRKLRLPDSLYFERQYLDDLIDEVYATDIYQTVIPALDSSGNAIILTLQEKPDVRTRGRLNISSTRGLTLYTRTDMLMSWFGGVIQADAAFGNIAGDIQLAIYPISYHKTGARLPCSIRPALEVKTSYHNHDLPGAQPLADRILSHELSIHSAVIGGWNRQLLLFGGLRQDDPGQIQAAGSDFDFPESYDTAMLFLRMMYKEDHVSRDLPSMRGWKFGFQCDWIWQDGIVARQNVLSASMGGKLISDWSATTGFDLYISDRSSPLFTMGKVTAPQALTQKYYMYLGAEQVLNFMLEVAHPIVRDDLLVEFKVNHSRFSKAFWSGLDQYTETGLSAADVSISYLTILGKLSLGWSFSELENYRGSSWTQIGITL